jgi:threonine dehydrogenase-like Zn-dependent dehydrogenase
VLREPYLCGERYVYGIHRSCADPPHLLGCYSEYLLLDARTKTFSLEGCDVDPSVLVAAGCSGATAAHCLEMAAPALGDVVVVQGPGPLGLFLVAMARRSGAREVVIIGGTQSRLDLARDLGATQVLNRQSTSVNDRRDAVLGLTGGRGADLVYEAVGKAGVVDEGLALVRHGGAYVSAGFGQPGGSLELDPFRDVVRKNVQFLGVWVSDTRHVWQALQLILSEPDTFAPLISHRYPLAQATEALQAMHQKEALKAVLLPTA